MMSQDEVGVRGNLGSLDCTLDDKGLQAGGQSVVAGWDVLRPR